MEPSGKTMTTTNRDLTNSDDGALNRPGEPASTAHKRWWSPRTFGERYLLAGVWVIISAFFAISRPASFLQAGTIHSIFSSGDVYVFLGLAALITSVVGELDLSVAFIAGLSATIVPVLVSQNGLDVWTASLIALIAAVLAGLVNAVIVVVIRVDSLIATLGTGTVFLGIANGISNNNPVGGLSPGFALVATYDVLGLPVAFWYGVILAAAITYLLAFTPLGRHIAFVGSNREVARLAGIRVNRIRFGTYLFAGLIAGIGGILLSAQLGGFQAAAATTYLLPTFAILFLSAAVVRPGRFHPMGVLIAAYFISTGTLGLQLFGLSYWTAQVFYGCALVVAVALVTLVRRKTTSA
jgi:ribose transport system permease protein